MLAKDTSPETTILCARLANSVQQVLTKTATPGASVALLLDGQPFFVSAVGFCDLEETTSLDPSARFYLYSITKSLIAAAILQLGEQGRLVLDDPVQRYLPQGTLETLVTLRQLLNHTGGLPDYGALPAYVADLKSDPTHPWTDDHFLRMTLAQGLLFPPGAGWAYSNIGYLLLRRVVETVWQSSLRAALHSLLFAPLGLQQTYVAQTLEDAEALTPGYSSYLGSADSLSDIRPVYHPGWVAHGVVVAPAREAAYLIDALFNGRLLSPASLAAMLAWVDVRVDHPLFRRPAYGLGVMIDPASRFGLMVGHGGGGPGYSTGGLHLPNVHGRRITSIALVNRDQGDLGLEIAFTLATLLGDALAHHPAL